MKNTGNIKSVSLQMSVVSLHIVNLLRYSKLSQIIPRQPISNIWTLKISQIRMSVFTKMIKNTLKSVSCLIIFTKMDNLLFYTIQLLSYLCDSFTGYDDYLYYSIALLFFRNSFPY